MRCPYCEHFGSDVIDTRPNASGKITRRRRKCQQCRNRFTTHEAIVTDVDVDVPELKPVELAASISRLAVELQAALGRVNVVSRPKAPSEAPCSEEPA